MEGTETLSVTGGIGVAAGIAGVSSLSGISVTVRYNGMVSAFGWRITLLWGLHTCTLISHWYLNVILMSCILDRTVFRGRNTHFAEVVRSKS